MINQIGEVGEAVCDVVMVNFNAGAFLDRAVKSVFSSTVPVALQLVDNASVDDSIAQIKQLNPNGHQFNIHQNAENLGFSKAVNIGAKAGSAAYVLLLNPDCEIHPHTIENLLIEAEKCADLGILGALVFNENGTEQRGCRRLEPTFMRSMVTALRLGKHFQSVNLQHEPLPDAAMSLDAVSGSAMLIKRTVFESVSGMDEGYFLHVEDLDICRRVREAGKKVYFTPDVSLFHHHGASSHAVPVKTEWHKHQGMLRYQSKFQQPNQSALRSLLTRGVIYLNFALSIVRKRLARSNTDSQPIITSLVNRFEAATLITGASSDLGLATLRELKQTPNVIALSRASNFPPAVSDALWLNWSYFDKVPKADFSGAKTWLALSPIWSAPKMAETLARFGKITRVVAMSSSSIEGKSETKSTKEKRVLKDLIQGELGLLKWGEAQQIAVTICRPSMIYGGDNNQNVAFIQRMIRRFGFFPLISKGTGLRQPVHVDDLAKALSALIVKPDLNQKTYTLAGAERLSYQSMLARIFEAEHKPVKLLRVPEKLLMRLVNVLSYIPGLSFINPEMVARMDDDLVYDNQPAAQDFAYNPEKFRP